MLGGKTTFGNLALALEKLFFLIFRLNSFNPSINSASDELTFKQPDSKAAFESNGDDIDEIPQNAMTNGQANNNKKIPLPKTAFEKNDISSN